MSVGQPDWDQLGKMREVLVHEFADRGVTNVEFVTAFSEPFVSAVWLCVANDTERDELLSHPDLLDAVHTVLRSHR